MKSGWILFLVIVLAGCGNKKKSGAEDSAMDVKDFFALFKPVKLPFTIGDTSFSKLSKDTPVIDLDLLNQFVGDTALTKIFGNAKPKIYPAGRASAKKAETYLFVKAVAPSRKAAYLFVFDKENQFKASLPLLVSDSDPETSQSASMDSRYTITINMQRKKPNGDLGYKKEAFVFNNIGVFTLILTESNEDPGATGEVFNPLDTLPKKNKLSADYALDKRNFISFMDGHKSSALRFFIHFEKSNGACKGELRGEATIAKPNIAIYRESGDPCVLEFTFGANSVTMKELEGCGNYRDIKCFFEGTYPRKKEKPKASKKK